MKRYCECRGTMVHSIGACIGCNDKLEPNDDPPVAVIHPVAWAAFRNGALLLKSVTFEREELLFEANGDWVGCELRPLFAGEEFKE